MKQIPPLKYGDVVGKSGWPPIKADGGAEIERLRQVVEAQVERLDYLEARHVKEANLLSRAADALEEEFGEPTLEGRDLSNKSPWNLIIELRKAAQ